MIQYYIDGQNLNGYGINVSRVTGLFDLPKLKDVLKISWPNRHGEVVDLSSPIYDVREIELDCWISASNRLEFLTRANAAMVNLFAKPNLRELKIIYEEDKPLLYYCYLPDGLGLTRQSKWDAALQVGRFTLKLVEPEPLKRIYRFSTASPNSTQLRFDFFDSSPQFTVYWGDGSFDVVNSGTSVWHSYANEGDYLVAIVGMVGNIAGLITQSEIDIIWNLL